MSLVAVGSTKVTYTTFEILRNGLWAFAKGFADSLRGAVDLFLLDFRWQFVVIFLEFDDRKCCESISILRKSCIMIRFRTTQQKEQKLQQREIDRELLINR
jgi:hypothetical protein